MYAALNGTASGAFSVLPLTRAPHASSVFRTVSASTRDVDTRDVTKDHPRIKPGQGLCSRQVIP